MAQNADGSENQSPKEKFEKKEVKPGKKVINLLEMSEVKLKKNAYGKTKGETIKTHPSNIPHLLASGLIEDPKSVKPVRRDKKLQEEAIERAKKEKEEDKN